MTYLWKQRISVVNNTSILEATTPVTGMVKELFADVQQKDMQIVVKNVPQRSTICMPTFKAYLAKQLIVGGLSEVEFISG